MADIASNIIRLKKEIPTNVKLVAVSKTKPVDQIFEAYNSGHRIFGENRVRELIEKKESLPDDIEWHFVGHLQSNKVKLIIPFISVIQSVDTFKLLQVINNEAFKNNRIVNCLLQFHIAEEETKFGFNLSETKEMIESEEFGEMRNIRLCGVMGMATYTDNIEQIRQEFRNLFNCYNELKNRYFIQQSSFCEVSMGMSGDFPVAIEEGSTMIRLGSVIFGERV